MTAEKPVPTFRFNKRVPVEPEPALVYEAGARVEVLAHGQRYRGVVVRPATATRPSFELALFGLSDDAGTLEIFVVQAREVIRFLPGPGSSNYDYVARLQAQRFGRSR
jgi:hypothetical protein